MTAIIGLALLGALAAIDTVAFRVAFDSSYRDWYLRNGALIGIVFGFVTVAWGDLNRLTGLVSAHPLEYFRSCTALGSLPSIALAASLRPSRTPTSGAEHEARPRSMPVVDVLLDMLFCVGFVLAFVAWLVVVAPLQYLVTLVAGAPARVALASSVRAWSRITPDGIDVEETAKSEGLPEGATESGFSAKPVTFTAGVATALLFVASKLVA